MTYWLAKTFGWTLDYIRSLTIDEVSGLAQAAQLETKEIEKQKREAERTAKRRR